MKLTEPRLPAHLVTTGKDLNTHLAEISESEWVGIDAERASGFRYSHRAYLVQISLEDRILLVDPFELGYEGSWKLDLAASLAKPLWILHSATQDLPCLAELGITPTRLFDTELAARILGVERFGLSSIAEAFLGLELEKEHSAADWSKRPLSDSMLRYAALDVDILKDLWESLKRGLNEAGKAEWANQEFEHLLHFKPKPAAEEPWRGLPGLSKIRDERGQQIAAGLWARRDAIAKERDVAPGRLVPDRSIMAVVTNPPESKGALAKDKNFQGRASRELLNDWWQAIEESKTIKIQKPKLDPNHMPNHRNWEKRFPEAHLRYTVIRPLMLELSESHGMAPEVLLTPDTLRRICFSPQSDIARQLADHSAREWQIQLCLETIERGLAVAESQQPVVSD